MIKKTITYLAETQGFTVDTHCVPPVAYKGPRFNPMEWHYCYTEAEELAERYRAALEWYADPIAYSMPVQDMNHHVFPDRGAVAREALHPTQPENKSDKLVTVQCRSCGITYRTNLYSPG